MKVLLVIILLLQLPAQRPAQDAPLSPAQLMQYREKVEFEMQNNYRDVQPGTTVKVFIRGEYEFMVLVRLKDGSQIVYLTDVKDVDNPKTLETFVPVRKR